MPNQLSQWDPIIEEKAKQYGVPPDLVRSVIWQESRGNQNAKSSKGAMGLMQLMPDTARGLGVNPLDPAQNIDGGVRYLKQQLDKFGLEGGVAAYNAGPGNVHKYGGIPPFAETQDYVSKVLGHYTGGPWNLGSTNTTSSQTATNQPLPGQNVFDQIRAPFTQIRDMLGVTGQPQEPQSAMGQAWQSMVNPIQDLYGVGRTLLKGANQGAGDILQTGANLLRDWNPVAAPLTMNRIGQGAANWFANKVGLPKLPQEEPGSPESRLHAIIQGANAPFDWFSNYATRLNQAAQAEPPTAFEQKYSKPIYKTSGGTTIIPSAGELARGTGEFIPEMALGGSAPAETFANTVVDRIGVKTPEIAASLKRALMAGFGGFMGGEMKGKPDEAVLNGIMFPLMSLGGEGMGFYFNKAKSAVREMLPQLKNMAGTVANRITADETGAFTWRPKTTPVPEAPETIAIQMEALQAGRSKAVLIVPGGEVPPTPKGFQTLPTKVGTWIYDPKQLKPFQIKSSVAKGDFGQHLGFKEPLGPTTTQDVAAFQNGIEAKSALTSPQGVPGQAAELQRQFPEAEIKVGGPEQSAQIITQRALKGQTPVVPPIQINAEVIPLRPTEAGGTPPIEPPGAGGGVERGFVKTVRESPMSPPQVAEGVSGTYNPITNEGTMKSAQAFVSQDPIKAKNYVMSAREGSADLYAIGMESMRHYNSMGDFDQSIGIANRLAQLATKQGQAVQALSMYDKLGPEGLLRLASKTVQEARNAAPSVKLKQLENKTNEIIKGLKAVGEQNINSEAIREQVAKTLKLPSLTPEFTQNLMQKVSALEAMPEGRAKTQATALILKDIADLAPSSILRKISTFQSMAQLLNLKTMIRNIAGNSAFAMGENLKDLIAVPLDKAMSIITGNRSRSFAGMKDQAKGFVTGMAQGAEDAWKGIDLTGIADKWEINTIKNGLPRSQTFRGPVLGNLEKVMNVGLRAPDRAFYQAAFNKTLAEEMAISGVDKPTDEMIKRAAFEGLYRTFQDDSVASRLFVGIKKALNLGKEFGVGDILLKYPKTPGNLMARSIDYSPAGFVHSLFDIGKAAVGRGFDQKHFVDMTSRALLGTGGLTAVGYGLAKIGLLRNSPPLNEKLRAIEKTEGLSQSQLNVTGTLRWIMSGFKADAAQMKPGDVLATYDWAVPMSVSISMGARAWEKQNEMKIKKSPINAVQLIPGDMRDQLANAGAGLAGGIETLGQQPLISTFTRMFQGKSLPDALMQGAEGSAAGFIPTILKQGTQVFDNIQRNPYSSNPLDMAVNLILQKTPLEGMLPPKVDPFGKNMEIYQNSTNTPFNTFLNPSFISEYRPSKEAQMVLNLYKSNSDTKELPTVVGRKFNFHGIPVELDAQQQADMQKWVGERTKNFFSQLADNPNFDKAPDEAKLKVLSWYLTNVRERGMAKVFMDETAQMQPEQRLKFLTDTIKNYKLSKDQAEGFFKGIMMYQAFNPNPSAVAGQMGQ